MSNHHIIYIPGLGDRWDPPRKRALSFWKFWGVTTELIPMQWYSGGSYNERIRAINTAIEAAKNRGDTISLIGESAGASIALNVFASDKRLYSLVTVCGVIYPEAAVSPSIYAKSAAFYESMQLLNDSISSIDATSRIHVVTSLYDPIVSHKHNVLDGIPITRIFSVGHLTTIALCLTVFSPLIIGLTKKHK